MVIRDGAIKDNNGMIDSGISDIEAANNGLSDRDINDIIDSMCQQRAENSDVMIMENIQNSQVQSHIIDPILEEKISIEMERDMIEREIVRDIFESGTPMSIEELNMLKAQGIYDKYIQNKQNENNMEEVAMTDLEEEMIQSMKEPLPGEIINENIQVNNDTDVDSNTSYPEKLRFHQQENGPITEEISIELSDSSDTDSGESEQQDPEDTTEKEVKEYDEMTDEEKEDFNDVPVSNLDVTDEDMSAKLNEQFKDLNSEDVIQMISVMRRYQAGEKFNVYAALPEVFRVEIDKAALDANVTDRSVINFFAKNFINDIVQDAFMSKEIKNFESELKEATKGMDNLPGMIIDSYSDDLKKKFEDNMLDLADKIEEENAEKADQLRRISASFHATYTLERIIENLKDRPSNINSYYKEGRDCYTKMCREFDEKFKDTTPRIKPLSSLLIPLTSNKETSWRSDYAKALIAMVKHTIFEATEDSSIEGHIYAYYMMSGFINLNFTANSSKISEELIKSINTVMDMIDNYMTNLWESKKNKKKTKNKK